MTDDGGELAELKRRAEIHRTLALSLDVERVWWMVAALCPPGGEG